MLRQSAHSVGIKDPVCMRARVLMPLEMSAACNPDGTLINVFVVQTTSCPPCQSQSSQERLLAALELQAQESMSRRSKSVGFSWGLELLVVAPRDNHCRCLVAWLMAKARVESQRKAATAAPLGFPSEDEC